MDIIFVVVFVLFWLLELFCACKPYWWLKTMYGQVEYEMEGSHLASNGFGKEGDD